MKKVMLFFAAAVIAFGVSAQEAKKETAKPAAKKETAKPAAKKETAKPAPKAADKK